MQTLTALGATAGALLKTRKETLAVAAASAGALLNASPVAVPGASDYDLGGVTVSPDAGREKLLGIPTEGMKGWRSATEAYAQLVARRVRAKLGATWGLAETGASGPSGNLSGDAPGHACIAVSGPLEAVVTLETGRNAREENMWAFAQRAVGLLRDCLRRA